MADDREAIERLHARDMAAARAWDVETLVSLWTDDMVALAPGSPPKIGKQANRVALERMAEQNRGAFIDEYVLRFEEVRIVGDWAFEWGSYAGTMRASVDAEPISSRGNVLRVLRRGADGEWRVARTMYNAME